MQAMAPIVLWLSGLRLHRPAAGAACWGRWARDRSPCGDGTRGPLPRRHAPLPEHADLLTGPKHTLEGIGQQGAGDALALNAAADRQTCQHHHGDRIGPIAPETACTAGHGHGTGGEGHVGHTGSTARCSSASSSCFRCTEAKGSSSTRASPSLLAVASLLAVEPVSSSPLVTGIDGLTPLRRHRPPALLEQGAPERLGCCVVQALTGLEQRWLIGQRHTAVDKDPGIQAPAGGITAEALALAAGRLLQPSFARHRD